MNTKSSIRTIKDGLRTTLVLYSIIGSCYGAIEYLSGRTTGHVSSDVYLGIYQPTKIETRIVNKISNLNDKLSDSF